MSKHTAIASFLDCDCDYAAEATARLISAAARLISAAARLIFAAPELLEALEMVRDADNDNGRQMPTLARAKIDAAIAKATGE